MYIVCHRKDGGKHLYVSPSSLLINLGDTRDFKFGCIKHNFLPPLISGTQEAGSGEPFDCVLITESYFICL